MPPPTTARSRADATRGLRILVADESAATLAGTERTLRGLGHEVTSYAVGVREAAEHVARDDPDMSIVVVDGDQEHALGLVEEMTAFARGPVVVLLDAESTGFIVRAGELGIYAFARSASAEEVQGAIELALCRHAEHRRLTEQVDQLEGALERRGVIERAKGILMERHGIGEREAFELLRDHARRSNRRVAELAQAVAEGHALLPRSGAD